MKKFGYVRVSTKDQNEDRQLIAMSEKGVPEENIYVDKESGKDFDRKNYRKLLKDLQEGDVLFIKSIDRLGRDYEEIQNQWRYITRVIKAHICVIDMPLLDTRGDKDLLGTVIDDIILQLLSYVAENERHLILQRQKEGISAAKARGVKFGRPKKEIPMNLAETILLKWHNEITTREALRRTGLCASTFYRYERLLKAELGLLESKEEQ